MAATQTAVRHQFTLLWLHKQDSSRLGEWHWRSTYLGGINGVKLILGPQFIDLNEFKKSAICKLTSLNKRSEESQKRQHWAFNLLPGRCNRQPRPVGHICRADSSFARPLSTKTPADRTPCNRGIRSQGSARANAEVPWRQDSSRILEYEAARIGLIAQNDSLIRKRPIFGHHSKTNQSRTKFEGRIIVSLSAIIRSGGVFHVCVHYTKGINPLIKGCNKAVHRPHTNRDCTGKAQKGLGLEIVCLSIHCQCQSTVLRSLASLRDWAGPELWTNTRQRVSFAADAVAPLSNPFAPPLPRPSFPSPLDHPSVTRLACRAVVFTEHALQFRPPSWVGESRKPGMSTVERPRVWDWGELGNGERGQDKEI